ncbi:MAG: Ig-like domain-containing protein [Alphaproteobacteria bacterium]
MATNNNDFISFSGTLQNLSVTLTNAYSGYTISIDDEEKNVNNSTYDGLGGNDILLLTNNGDVLFIDDGAGNQTFDNIETVIAGNGGDVIDLSSTVHIVSNGINISGGLGDDVLWGNVGDDIISGGGGNDILDGGPGHDTLQGQADNDYLSGWTGNDTLDGGTGDDVLLGGAGEDNYIFSVASGDFGNDIIIEDASSEINTITFTDTVLESDITFEFVGNDLILNAGSYGSITIQNQLLDNGSGIDSVEFSDATTLDLRSVEKPNEAPVAQDDVFSGDEDTQISGNVLDNDSDNDGGTLSVVAGTFTTVQGGTVALLANGDFTYTPVTDFFGQDSFNYTLKDGQGGSDTASVTLDVADVIDYVDTNLDIRVSHDNIATKFIDSTDGYDLRPTGYGIVESVDAQTMDVASASSSAQVSYSFADVDSASVTLDSAWNSMKNIEVSSDGAGNISLNNFVHTDVSFGNGGDSTVTITDAKRGFITTGDGNDTITVDAFTNNAGWSNVFDIQSGAGMDSIDFTGDKGITEVLINAGADDDVVTMDGNYKTSEVLLGSGDDSASGGNGADTIYGEGGNDILLGGEGADTLLGGAGDDILYGGNNTAPFIVDKEFNDDVPFPDVIERKNIRTLDPPGEPSLGVKDPNLNVDFDATASLTFKKGHAGYNNSLGIYNIAEDGTIQMASLLWENVKTAGFDIAHQIDIPGAGDFGFFIIANGDRRNKGYDDMDTSESGSIRFIYDLGGANEREATIYDDGNDISVVYDNGTSYEELKGEVYHTTERGGSADLNADGKIHTVSGLANEGDNEVLKIGFEDLKNLGDADFEDVLFEIDINETAIDQSE